MNELLDPYFTFVTVLIAILFQLLLIICFLRVSELPVEMITNLARTQHLKIVYRRLAINWHLLAGVEMCSLFFDYNVLTFVFALFTFTNAYKTSTSLWKFTRQLE